MNAPPWTERESRMRKRGGGGGGGAPGAPGGGGGGGGGNERGRGRANGVDLPNRTDGADSPKAEPGEAVYPLQP
jgi:hypothetical protein